MFKKMFISMLTMLILTFGIILFMLQGFDGSVELSDPEETFEELKKTFDDQSYFYFLSDKQINKAIEAGTNSIKLIEEYKLIIQEDTTDGSEVAFAYIEPPYLTVKMESRRIFDHYGRTPIDQELKNDLMDQYLPIHVRFNENKGYVFNIKVEQEGKEIEPIQVNTRGSGAMKTIILKVADIDFSARAKITVEDIVDASHYVDFEIDFHAYKQ